MSASESIEEPIEGPVDLDDVGSFSIGRFDLQGKAALVTGGSRGLGLGIARALFQCGARITLCARTAEDLSHARRHFAARPHEVFTVVADPGEANTPAAAVTAAHAHMGRLDILVNAAGFNPRKPATACTADDWGNVMALNLRAAFFAAQAAHPLMCESGGGRIINILSMTVARTVPNSVLYAISKGGLKQMTEALAREWASDGINVNGIAPGRFWTRLNDAVFRDPEKHAAAISVIPLARPGRPADLAGTALLLASDAGAYITGQTIFVDGGWLVDGGVPA